MGLYDTIAGAADHVAGSTDESIARQFDDESGGGFADYDTWAGVGDHAAGSVDESIGRQFDDSPGGGIVDFGGRERTNPSIPDEQGQEYFFDHHLGNTDEWASRLPGGNTVDWLKDASGSGHQDDTVDLPGPELNLSGFNTNNDESPFVWNGGNDTQDPLKPENLNLPFGMGYGSIGALLVLMIVLYLLKPVLEIASTAAEGV